jgi:pimeloyl-ACP methyl ester carboxylesterase
MSRMQRREPGFIGLMPCWGRSSRTGAHRTSPGTSPVSAPVTRHALAPHSVRPPSDDSGLASEVRWRRRSNSPSLTRRLVQTLAQEPSRTKDPSPACSTTAAASGDGAVRVQRHYETFWWTYAPTRETYRINYRVEEANNGQAPRFHVLLIHGFGANLLHFRKNQPVLAQEGHRVFALDLLGFGASEKPSLKSDGRNEPEHVDATCKGYSLELWRDLCLDFIREMDRRYDDSPHRWVICGNSIGGLIALMTGVMLQHRQVTTSSIVAADNPIDTMKHYPKEERQRDRLAGLVLLNCAGGLTGIRFSELSPIGAALWWLFTTIFFRSPLVYWLFERIRRPASLRQTLRQIYRNAEAITEELIEILRAPAHDDGARDVFAAVLRGDAGPTPRQLLQQLSPEKQVLVLWGRDDPWTPFDRGLHPGTAFPNWVPVPTQLRLICIEDCGHCPHDDAPERVNAEMCTFLRELWLVEQDRRGQQTSDL